MQFQFEQLVVWQEGCAIAKQVYQVFGAMKDFGFRDQITRSSVSIASNIAEGEERQSLKESIHFLYIAKGSVGELYTQLCIAEQLGYITPNAAAELKQKSRRIAFMLGKLINAKKKKLN